MSLAVSGYRQEVRQFVWSAFEPRAALLPLPAIAIALIVGLALGHPQAAMVAAGGAQTAGFGAFQKPLWFRAGPIVISTLGMAISATLGCLLSDQLVVLIAVAVLWAFVYGMMGAISSPAQWVGQQCCTFLVISSAFPSNYTEAAMRGMGVLAGGLLQSLLILVLWTFCQPARSSVANEETHPPGWRLRAIRENLKPESPILHFAIRLSGIAVVSIVTYRLLGFPNAYWIPMTALILPKQDVHATLLRGISRVGGTIVGAGLATLLAIVVRPYSGLLILLVLLFIWAAYALQNVNYAAFVVMLTCYIAFDLAIGKQPEALTAWHRILATTVGGFIAIAAHFIHLRLVRRADPAGQVGVLRQGS